MLKKVLSTGLIIFILFGLYTPAYGQEADLLLPSGIPHGEIGQTIEKLFAENEATNAAMAVAVFNDQEVIYQNTFGYQDKEKEVLADSNTVFEWGSISKLLVWVSVMQLWEQGKLELDKDVQSYLPEGFLSNLSFDEPVTMLNLMNHTAGFQEGLVNLFVKDEADVLSLGEALQEYPPAQIYKPGTVTAYSNWGTALAAYIVELKSGMNYDQYVRKNIFEPLGMEHTAISVDLQDNKWVAAQREQIQGYTNAGDLFPDSFYYIPLYPAGACTGTLDDLRRFAQALKGSIDGGIPLFANANTLKEMLSPTAWYGDTGRPSNYHGLWGIELGVSVLGHGGNTASHSSYLLLAKDSGLGVVVMTNQNSETKYNGDMMDLIFGSYKDSQLAADKRTVPGGLFRTARNIMVGPFSIYSTGMFLLSQEDSEDNFWAIMEEDGLVKQISPYGDILKVSPKEYIPLLGLVLLLAVGVLYSLITLVVGGLILTPLRRRRDKRLGLWPERTPLRKWNHLGCGLIMLFVLNMLVLVAQVMTFAPARSYLWQITANGVLGLAMLLLLIYLIIAGRRSDLTRGSRIKNTATSVFLAAAVVAIIYWQLYAFWAV